MLYGNAPPVSSVYYIYSIVYIGYFVEWRANGRKQTTGIYSLSSRIRITRAVGDDAFNCFLLFSFLFGEILLSRSLLSSGFSGASDKARIH